MCNSILPQWFIFEHWGEKNPWTDENSPCLHKDAHCTNKETKSKYQKNGSYQVGISTTMPMNSSVARNNAKGWYSASLTWRMLDQLATSASMSGHAGVKRFWILLILWHQQVDWSYPTYSILTVWFQTVKMSKWNKLVRPSSANPPLSVQSWTALDRVPGSPDSPSKVPNWLGVSRTVPDLTWHWHSGMVTM